MTAATTAPPKPAPAWFGHAFWRVHRLPYQVTVFADRPTTATPVVVLGPWNESRDRTP